MKKFEEEKGITLVALIITIVVLLILAAVAIGTVRDSDIIGHAQNAAIGYNQAKENEIVAISKYENIINNVINTGKDGYEQYLGKAFVAGNETMIAVMVVNKEGESFVMTMYQGEKNATVLEKVGSIPLYYFGTNTFDPITIKENGKPVTIDEKAIVLQLDESGSDNSYILGNKLYYHPVDGAELAIGNFFEMDPNFDTTRLEKEKNILKECYVGIVENMQVVLVIDYENKIIKAYGKMDDGNFKYGESTNIINVSEINSPFIIKLNGEDKDIGTGGIKIDIEEDSASYYIKDESLFIDVSEGTSVDTEDILILDPNFDFNKLVE